MLAAETGWYYFDCCEIKPGPDEYLKEVLKLMNKGWENLTAEVNDLIRNLALAIQKFEQAFYQIPAPKNLSSLKRE